MPTTTTNALDALLAIYNGNPTARWNFAAAVGTPIDNPAGTGTGVELTYSFRTAAPGYAVTGFSAFDAMQQEAARLALERVAEVADVRFTEVAEGGQVTFGNSEQTGTSGYAYYPNWSSSSEADGIIRSVAATERGGDVWMASNLSRDPAYWSPGAWAFKTLLHEMGHALGLKHPFEAEDDGHVLDASLNHRGYTVMSYDDAPNNLVLAVTGTAGSYRTHYEYLQPSTLMLGDVQALQHLYGANLATRTGNDTYRWEAGEELLQTLWDAGGKDTIDASNQVLACEIDLRPGSFSSIGLRQTAAEMRIGFDLPADYYRTSFPANTYDGRNNLAIAEGAVIENAVGGSAGDRLTGNTANNLLDGGAGIDAMEGGAGNDTYLVDDVADQIVETAGGGTDTALSTAAGYLLPAHVENGRITTTRAADLAGNGLGNTLYAGKGANVLSGGGGRDTLSYAYGATQAITASLATIWAQDTGGSGIDRISSVENLTGSKYNDRLGGNAANNVLNGGGGTDTVAYTDAAAGVRVDLGQATAQDTGGAGVDTLRNFENVAGSRFADHLLGNTGANVLNGGAGADTLAGGLGNDSFVVDDAGDLVQENPGESVDLVLSLLAAYNLPLNVENGRMGYRGAEPGMLLGNDADNAIEAGRGNDILSGGNGIDTLSYAWGSTRGVNVQLDVLAAQATGGSGTDRITGFENLVGSRFDDTLAGSAGSNVLEGGAGNDTLAGAAGRDWLAGGAGNDVFRYTAATDTLATSSGRDVITDFTAAADRIDLSAIDANTATASNNAFRFIGSAAFSSNATGQVRYTYNAATDIAIVHISTDADRTAEMTIQLTGTPTLTAADFIL